MFGKIKQTIVLYNHKIIFIITQQKQSTYDMSMG